MGGYLETRDLTKTFDTDPVVNSVSVSISKGEVFSLLGGSGCGKSTLLRMIAGFEFPTSGSVILDGKEIESMPPYERPMNMMFQSYALFPHLSVFENVAFGLRRESQTRDFIRRRVGDLLDLVELVGYEKRLPSQLSGGQQQRVALARCLAKKPSVLLLDEPLGALDKKLRERTQFELTNIIRQIGVTCLMVTHDQEEAMSMSQRIGVMKDGKILQIGTPECIYNLPNSIYVADFIGSVNLLQAEIVEPQANYVTVRSVDGLIQCLSRNVEKKGAKVTVAIRPETIKVSQPNKGDVQNAFNAVIVEMAFLGAHTTLIAKTPAGSVLKVNLSNRNSPEADLISVGSEVSLSWHSEAALALAE